MKTTTPTSFRQLFSISRLRATWKALRKELPRVPVRDCIDYLEIDMASDNWLSHVQRRVLDGSYHPHHPWRFEVAKTNGAYRVITLPAIEDTLIYRHICDFIYRRAKPSEPRGAFFSRRFGMEPVGKKVDSLSDTDYLAFFHVWLRYSNYRKHLGLSGLFKYIVVTDITNFFDSIQHALLLEYLAPYGVPREALGVLGKLIDVLRPTAGHSATPPVGLPVDLFDCSRTLAHLFLFEHDRRITEFTSEEAYVRWMDDQNVGVKSRTQARCVVRQMVQSLASQRLTFNSSKTKVLSPQQVVEYFWLDENEAIDELEESIIKEPRTAQESRVGQLWDIVQPKVGEGHWDKIVKRLLRLTALARSDKVTYADCQNYLVTCPQLAERVFEYLLARGRYDEHLRLFRWFLSGGNSLYEDVETAWFDSLLLASPPRSLWGDLRKLAVEFIRGAKNGTQRAVPRVPAALLIYWLWDGRQGRVLETMLRGSQVMDGPTRRTTAAILCARRPQHATRWLLLAGRQASPHVSSLIEWVSKLRDGESVAIPQPLVFVKRPVVLNRFVYDARAWLRLELLSLSPRSDVRAAIRRTLRDAKRNPLQNTEIRILTELEERLK